MSRYQRTGRSGSMSERGKPKTHITGASSDGGRTCYSQLRRVCVRFFRRAGGGRGGFDVAWATVDEIHSFAEGRRGSLLALALERLEARSSKPMR